MISLGDKLKEVLAGLDESWTQEERELVELVAKDYADLTAGALLGEDVGGELAQVRAQASNIAAGAAGTVAIALEDGIKDFLKDLVSELLPGF